MSEVLAPPFLVAALVLCAAGALKLRSPEGAARALRTLGFPAGKWRIRALAAGELALGAACAAHPAPATAAVLAGAYATFTGVAAAMARRRVPCGCFGEDATPVSAVHVTASAALAVVALAAALATPAGLGWLLGRSAPAAVALLLGLGGAVYAVVLVYVEVPRAWGAWAGE